MSEINKPVEMSAAELDEVAGGAVNAVLADNFNFSDTQATVTALGANGGITNANVQETKVSEQQLAQLQTTGELPGIPNIFPGK